MYESGSSCRDIALILGVGPAQASKILRRAGALMRSQGRAQPYTGPGVKICSACHEQKGIAEYGKNSDSPDGLFSWCKLCASAKNKTYRRVNRARLLTQRREQRKQSPWRQLASAHIKHDVGKGHAVFSSREERLSAVHELASYYERFPDRDRCGVSTCTNTATEWDEVVYGKGHVPGNVGRLCFNHNRMKRNATLQDLEALASYVRLASHLSD